jgi:mRNA interferase RelE/StbE
VTAPRYTLQLRPAAARAIRKLPKSIAARIKVATDELLDDPWPPGARKLKGRPDWYRVRVGDYRIVYTILDGQLVLLVLAIGHRREIYHDI